MKSLFYRKATDRIISIEVTLRRENEADTHVAFVREDKIKDLIESEPFFRDLASHQDHQS